MEKLLIIGAGGHGRVVAEAAELSGQWKKICFLDDCYPTVQKSWKWDVVGDISSFNVISKNFDNVIVAIGNQSVRATLLGHILESGVNIATVIHPNAQVSSGAVINKGSVILSGAIIGPQAYVGVGAIVNINSCIDHDVYLGDYVHCGVGVKIAGGATIEKGACLKVGSIIGAGYHLNEGAVISPGSILYS